MMIVGPSKTYARSHQDTVPSRIAKVVEKHYDEYGIWPSVAIGQAFRESTLGKGPNMFGVRGCAGLGVEEATMGYLKCLQNKYFRGEANFAPTPAEQLTIIMRGGRYCEHQYPDGSYYWDVINSINKYGWRRYDKKIIKKIKAKEARKRRKKRQKRPFRIIFDDTLPEGTAVVDPEYIKNGSAIIFPGRIVEVIDTEQELGNVIRCSLGRRSILPRQTWTSERVFFTEPMFKDKGIRLRLTEVIENVRG